MLNNKNIARILVFIACFWGFWITKEVMGTGILFSPDYISQISKEISIAEGIKGGRNILGFYPQNLGKGLSLAI